MRNVVVVVVLLMAATIAFEMYREYFPVNRQTLEQDTQTLSQDDPRFEWSERDDAMELARPATESK